MFLLGFHRELTALALCKSIESAIQWFQIHHRITFATIQNLAVYLSGARVSIFSTLVPRLYCYGLTCTCSKYKPWRTISACVHHKILDDLTQKLTKLIRTELVKMTLEASLLPTDLKNIHQTVYRSRRKMFPKLPKNPHELHE